MVLNTPDSSNSEIIKELQKFQKYKQESRIIYLPFETVTDYLALLQSVSERVESAGFGVGALMYLAAAVSDFYIPREQVSRKEGRKDLIILF